MIAEKAIVCYKCGTPTAEGPEVSRSPAPRLRSRPALTWLAVAIAVAAVVLWVVPATPEGTWLRGAAWAVIPAVILVGVRLTRSRSSRLRRQ